MDKIEYTVLLGLPSDDKLLSYMEGGIMGVLLDNGDFSNSFDGEIKIVIHPKYHELTVSLEQKVKEIIDDLFELVKCNIDTADKDGGFKLSIYYDDHHLIASKAMPEIV